MIERRKLGTVYTLSPSKRVKQWFINNMSKIMFSIFVSICWLGILFALVGVINFLGAHVGEQWEKDIPTLSIYNNVAMLPLKVIGVIIVFLYVFRDRPTKRR